MRFLFSRLNFNNALTNPYGFSLIEMAVCLGVMSILTVGLSATLLDMQRSKLKGESDANVISTAQRLNQALQRKTSALDTRVCKDVLAFTGTFNPSGQTNVSIALEDHKNAK